MLKELTQKMRLDGLVAKAKAHINKNGFNEIAKGYLAEPLAANHPEAVLLAGDAEKASKMGLQRYRLVKAIEDYNELLKISQQQNENQLVSYTGTGAYYWFQSILKHPIYPESEDVAVRGRQNFYLQRCVLQGAAFPVLKKQLPKEPMNIAYWQSGIVILMLQLY